MSQNVELAKVKLRIKAYLERTVDRGFTENESLIAAQKLGELIEQFDINLSELDLADEVCVKKTYDVPGYALTGISALVMGIASFTNTRCWFTRGYKSPNIKVVHYHFFGLDSDTDMAVWLADTLQKTLENETVKFKKSPYYNELRRFERKSAHTAFQRGFAARVYRRLMELKAQNDEFLKRDAEHKSAFSGKECRSLVLVKGDKVDSEFAKLNLHLGKNYSTHRINDAGAYKIGHEAGNRANINRPINNSSSVKLIA